MPDISCDPHEKGREVECQVTAAILALDGPLR